MSGFRNRNASDVVKNRNAYMASLQQQEQINDMNLQVNKNYLLTGQLPPTSQIQDTRTASEKLKDVDTLKQNIAKDLSDIAEPPMAYAIVSKVMNSPLNVNNSLFRFLAQRAKQINEQLKPMYPYKIEGDVNDVELIVKFINNMYTNTQGNFQSVKSYINTYSTGSNQSRVMSVNDIDPIITSLSEIIKNIDIGRTVINSEDTRIKKSLRHSKLYKFGGIATRNRLQSIITKMLELKNALPTTEQLDYFLKSNEKNLIQNLGPEMSNRIKALFDFLENHMPKYQDIATLIKKGNQYLKFNDYTLFKQTLERIFELFGFLFNDKEFSQFLRSILPIKQIGTEIQTNNNNMHETQILKDIKKQTQAEKEASKATKVFVMNEPLRISNKPTVSESTVPNPNDHLMTEEQITNLNEQSENSSDYISENSFDDIYDSDYDIQSVKNQQFLPQYQEEEEEDEHTEQKDTNIFGDYIYNLQREISGINNIKMLNDIKNSVENFIRQLQINNEDFPTNKSQKQLIETKHLLQMVEMKIDDLTNPDIEGTGLKNIKPKKRSNFIGFGISEINNRSLENNIVKIRRPNSKSNYMDLPSRRVSPHMKNIISRIAGGGMPEFDDLSKMDNDEKIYLNKLLTKADLKGRLSIPTPSKDIEEKEIHEFEVLKGQIMSGNDSIQLVKKFKLLIRRLSQKQMLPRKEVNDMLDVLADLGY